MNSKYQLVINSFGRDRFKFDEPLKDHTALHVGGPAKLFFIAFKRSELIKIISMCIELKLPYLIFGSGTKIMMSDEGFDGLVIKNRTQNISTISVKGKATRFGIGVDEVLVEVDSGVSINKFVEYLDSQGLAKDDLLGIPGSIGGNISISKILQSKLKSIKVMDSKGETLNVGPNILNPKKYVVLSAILRIKAKG